MARPQKFVMGRCWLIALLLSASLQPAVAAPPIAGHFSLSAGDGRQITERSFRGRWKLVFFGFTTCPDVCSTVMSSVGTALSELGSKAELLQPLFITLDPARDTSQRLREYLSTFSPRIVGLRGDEAATREAAASYRVFFETRSLGEDSYTFDHSAFLYLMRPNGSFARLLSGDMPGHALADVLRQELQ